MIEIDLKNHKSVWEYFLGHDVFQVHSISDYFSWLEINVKPTSSIKLKLNDDDNVYLQFIYNLKAPVILSANGTDIILNLDVFQSAVLLENDNLSTYMTLTENSSHHLIFIQVKKYDAIGNVNTFFSQYDEAFRTMIQKSYFMHTGLPNLKIDDYIQKLSQTKSQTIAHKIQAEGLINIILGLKLQQYIDAEEQFANIKLLTKHEIKKLKELSDRMLANPGSCFRVEDSAMELGLNANKIQIYYKEKFNRTFNNQLIHLRLIKAEELLKDKDNNISQITYLIGYSSKSYFSKIFRENYHCTPTEYRNRFLKLNSK